MKNKYCNSNNIIDPSSAASASTIADLIDDAFLAYNAGRIREACRLLEKKISRDDVLIGVSLAGALTPAGLGLSCIIPLMHMGLIDWISSTGANLYHDLHFTLKKNLYRGSPNYDDAALRHAGIIRIYDIVFEYDVLLSTDAFIRSVVSGHSYEKYAIGTAELHNIIGRYAAERERQLGMKHRSILSTAYEYGIPVYVPSPGDSSIGMNIASCALKCEGAPLLDSAIDVNETASFVYHAKKSGGRSAVIIFGGGAPKNFMLQTEPHIQEVLGLEETGHDYFIQVTDARPDTGGLSGATPAEAVSWGKIDPGGVSDTVVAYADTTIVMPLLTAYAAQRGIKRQQRRLYENRSESVEMMKRDVLSLSSGRGNDHV
jgi:deoxyhypusine synthase